MLAHNEGERRWELSGYTISRSWCLLKDLSKGVATGARKMISYA
jgi:hypothetical protein